MRTAAKLSFRTKRDLTNALSCARKSWFRRESDWNLERLTKRSLEEVPADEDAADVQEGLVDVGAAFIADGEPPKAVEPGKGALDHPAMLSELLTGFNTPARNASLDAALAQEGPAAAMVICLVRVKLRGPA